MFYVNVTGRHAVRTEPEVVHAVIETTEPDDHGSVQVLAPAEFAARWPSVNVWFGDWQPEPGPARLLSREKWLAVVAGKDLA